MSGPCEALGCTLWRPSGLTNSLFPVRVHPVTILLKSQREKALKGSSQASSSVTDYWLVCLGAGPDGGDLEVHCHMESP